MGRLESFCQSFRMLRTLSANQMHQLALRISSLQYGTNGLLRSAAISPGPLPKHYPSHAISARYYAQPPGGRGSRNSASDGLPSFSTPQQEKGAALNLKEQVSCSVPVVACIDIEVCLLRVLS